MLRDLSEFWSSYHVCLESNEAKLLVFEKREVESRLSAARDLAAENRSTAGDFHDCIKLADWTLVGSSEM